MSTELTNYAGAKWTTGDCETIYKVKNNRIGCKCSSVGTNFYGVITDTTRFDPTNPNPGKVFDIELLSDKPTLSVIVILLVMLLCLPVIAIILDKVDYSSIKENKQAEVSDELLLKFAAYKK